jgi:hypothetical protein
MCKAPDLIPSTARIILKIKIVNMKVKTGPHQAW